MESNNKISLMEKEEIINSIKMKDFWKLEKLFTAFDPLIKKSYRKIIKKKDRLSAEEFASDCYEIILDCAKKFEGNTYGELCTYISVTIEKRTLTIERNHDNHWRHNILGELEDNALRIVEPHVKYFEDMILSLLTLKSHCGKYAKDKLSPYDIEILRTHIKDGDLRELAERRGVKYESVVKARVRALEKLRKIAVSLGITSSKDDYIIA